MGTSDFRRDVIAAIERGTTEDKKLESTPNGDLFVSQSLPYGAEMVRQGNVWSVIQTTATAALVVRPSVLAAITLWNGEGSGGKSYIIDRLFAHCLVSVALTEGVIWACIHPAGMTKPSADIPSSAVNLNGASGKVYLGNGLAVVDVGATVVDNGWYPWGIASYSGVITTPGGLAMAEVNGRLVVPPQGAISLQVVCATTGATFCSGLTWIEQKLELL